MPKEANSKKHRRPRGYWDEWENVKQELQLLINKLGKFPSSKKDLDATGNSSLRATIIEKHGGFDKVRKRLGYETQKITDEKLIADLRAVAERLKKKSVTFEEYERFGKFSANTVRRRFGSWNKALKVTNLELNNDYGVKAEEFLDDLRRVANLVGKDTLSKEEYDKYGEFCSETIVRHFKRWQLALQAVDLKESPRKGPPIRWPIERIETEYLRIYKQLGRSPTQKLLRQLRLSNLCKAIGKRYPGGINGLRKKFGHKSPHRPRGHYLDLDTIEIEFKQIADKIGHAPTYRELQKLGYPRLAQVIIDQYPGKTNGLLTKLGFRLRKGYWEQWKNTERAVKEFIDQYDEFPTDLKLRALKRIDILTAIRMHGGFGVVRARMGYGPITGELLKLNAEPLVRVLFALQKAKPDLKSDEFLAAIKKNWTEKQLKEAIQAFTDKNELEAFEKLVEVGQ